MSDISEEFKALLDREKIRDCIARVARGEDRRDATLIRGAFWPDATMDYGIFAGSFEQYIGWTIPGSPAIPVTQHVLGQCLIDLSGDSARSETHVMGYHRVNNGKEERDSVVAGRYLDRSERRKGEWRIAKRTMLYDWVQDWGLSADWSKGLMGMPFSSDQYTGKTTTDHSVTFFLSR